MQYAGNRLMSVTDGNSVPMLYDYDADTATGLPTDEYLNLSQCPEVP